MQVWLKPDVLERLDAYCAIYGIGRGRAIGHLLKGALPDPSWLPSSVSVLPHDDRGKETPKDSVSSQVSMQAATTEQVDSDLASNPGLERPQARFVPGDWVTNNTGNRHGRIDAEPRQWVPPARLSSGEIRPGHWSYAVAWEGQMGLTIRYAEDLLRPLSRKADPSSS